ncbi:unnamed protein product [Lactuca virosa]|uniref:Uncharacterized protein n=1 Tax=Lactuca virosa TaxID=75947 RepID=A0AAU9N7W9_9ASTR|nr:unnamed protein product [Lactuca virosa]
MNGLGKSNFLSAVQLHPMKLHTSRPLRPYPISKKRVIPAGIELPDWAVDEKAPYEAKAAKRKIDYEKLMTAYNKKQDSIADDDEESEKSKSEVDEESGQEGGDDDEDDDCDQCFFFSAKSV